MDRIVITVGSMSTHKINAVKRACAALGIDAEVIGVGAPSLVNEQPSGWEETEMGARNRMLGAWRKAAADEWCLGIESGVIGSGGRVVDVAALCLRSPDGREWGGATPGTPFSFDDYCVARRRGFKTTTVGLVMSERTGCDKTDGTAFLTGGRVTREDTLVDGLTPLFAVAMREMLDRG